VLCSTHGRGAFGRSAGRYGIQLDEAATPAGLVALAPRLRIWAGRL
jgi:hypothetical protein